jgi:HEPN domain-containing protein
LGDNRDGRKFKPSEAADVGGGVTVVADNYPEAARKHVHDSEALLNVKRYDGAGYLAGYAVECTLKTLIFVETRGGGGGHDLSRLSARALQLLILSSKNTASYVKLPGITSLSYGPAGWRETLRYEPEGTVSQTDSESWVSEARRLHDEVIIPMKKDGVIP